jgi:predicted Zn-dependent protease with MMP-like domain
MVTLSGCPRTSPPLQEARAGVSSAVTHPAARAAPGPAGDARQRCMAPGRASARALVDQAGRSYDEGNASRALACAEEALSSAPRLVSALHYRAAALAALGHLEDAQVAYARALAVDPDDPDTLHGAADLYVERLAGDRSRLELGLEYALRGARLAQRPPHRDPRLAAQLLVVAAMAENDLGQNAAALQHANEALAVDSRDLDATYEKGVALYEICRFAEARAALARVLALAPDDAWAHHQLSLVSERLGDVARAAALERRARELAPAEFRTPVALDGAAFEAEVKGAIAALPAAERRALTEAPVEIADLPALDDLTAVDPPLSPSILGLFRGPSEEEPCLPEDGPRCRSIVLYRQNLLRYARDRQDLAEQVRITLLHELGHLHGDSEDDLRERGLE